MTLKARQKKEAGDVAIATSVSPSSQRTRNTASPHANKRCLAFERRRESMRGTGFRGDVAVERRMEGHRHMPFLGTQSRLV